jgi:hypothetical protein
MFARELHQVELTVTVDITALEFRRLNSFEWAVLSLLNTFQADAPTIAEASAQLCVGEPAFLAAALESLRSAGAVRPKSDISGGFDLDEYELSETGITILGEDGWETGEEINTTEFISLDWPSMRLVFSKSGGKNRARREEVPGPDEVQEKLTVEGVQEWLNREDQSRFWCVQNYYVTNVEG